MTANRSISYKDAGVDIDAKMRVIDGLKARVAAATGDVAGPIGQFGGTWQMNGPADQVLVASADGVGTKLVLAHIMGGLAHETMGSDIVHHCVNDVLALGATPLFFLDYFATGRLDPDVFEAVIAGLHGACATNGMALLGGETAEMPDMYDEGHYDLAGFIVGSVTNDRKIDGSSVQPGDIVIGLPSTGLHTNGYSLARKVIGLTGDLDHDRDVLRQPLPGTAQSIGDALMAGHRSYLSQVMPLLDDGLVRGMAHITGGGLTDNLPRTLPESSIAVLDPSLWESLPIFEYLVERAGMPLAERYRVFNMGIGFVLIVAPGDAATALSRLPGARAIGRITARQTSDESAVQGLFC